LDLINMLAAGLECGSVIVAGVIVNPLLIILIIPTNRDCVKPLERCSEYTAQRLPEETF
jgi:hypothetical protein